MSDDDTSDDGHVHPDDRVRPPEPARPPKPARPPEPALPLEPARGRGVAAVSPWLVAALLVVVAALVWQTRRPAALFDAGAEPRAITPRGDLAGDEAATIELFRTANDSVVHITSYDVRRDRYNLNLFKLPQGTGSGFVWDRRGYVVTNYHVIAKAGAAQVMLADGSTYDARFVGAEPDHDVAVLKIDAPEAKLPPIAVGASADLQVGQKVFAIGNPFGFDQTLTTGVISGLGREIESMTKVPIQGVIQTDAAINPGNSGGPLLDSAPVGWSAITTAIYSPSGAYAGVGFAVPVDAVNRIVPQLVRDGVADLVGLGIRTVPDEVVRSLVRGGKLPEPGVLVVALSDAPDEGPGGTGDPDRTPGDARDALLAGDLIVGVEGQPIAEYRDLYRALDGRAAGGRVTVTVLRDGRREKLAVPLKVLPRFSP